MLTVFLLVSLLFVVLLFNLNVVFFPLFLTTVQPSSVRSPPFAFVKIGVDFDFFNVLVLNSFTLSCSFSTRVAFM